MTAVLGRPAAAKVHLVGADRGLAPAAGTVEVLGQAVPRRTRDLLELRKGIGVLLRGNGLLTDLTAAETWRCRCARTGCRAVIDRLVEMKLHAVGLRAAADLFRANCRAAWRAAWRRPARSRSIRR